MTRKKEAKELIEILLRQQRANRPQRQDPLEGLEWEGLPPELRDRVYRPLPKKEPLVELLSSIEQTDTTEPMEETVPRPRAAEPVLLSEEAVEPETERSPLPASPRLHERFSDWFFHVFTFLNKSYEVRVATILVFGAAAVFVASLCYLLGRAGTESSFQLHNHAGPVSELSRMPTEERDLELARAVDPPSSPGPVEEYKQEQPPAPRKKTGTPPVSVLPAKGYAVQVSTATTEKAAKKLCDYMQQQGYEDLSPRYYRTGGGNILVILGRWATRSEANERLTVLKADLFPAMVKEGLLYRVDQIVQAKPTTN